MAKAQKIKSGVVRANKIVVDPGSEELTKGERTRLRILETAMKLSHKHGPLGFTLQSVSEGSGLTQSGIYAYFKNITDVVVNMALYAAELGRDFIDERLSKESLEKLNEEARIRKYLELNFYWIFKFRYQVQAVFALYYLGGSPTASKESDVAQRAFKILNSKSEERILSFLDSKTESDKVYVEMLHSALVGEMIKVLNNYYPKGVSLSEYVDKMIKKIRRT